MSREVRKKKNSAVSDSGAAKDIELLKPAHLASPFISFRYSCREISSDGVNTHIRSSEKSFENGRFKSEEFEGILPGSVYTGMVGQM